MTKATHFNEREQQICLVARMIEDGKTYWVGGAGSPLAAILLGKKRYAPTAAYVTEDGVIAPEPALPFDPLMSMVSAEAGYRALQWVSMNLVGFHAQTGFMDYGIINALQVDSYGNINSTAIGDYEGEHRRFGGPGGGDSIAALCWRTIVMTDQQKRKFVPRVDFISSPGFLDGSPSAREAVTNSRCFRESTCPRTSCATGAQLTSARARNTARSDCPSTAARMMISKRLGNASVTSMTRITKRSVRPPA